MSRFTTAADRGKSGQGVTGTLLARDRQVRTFDAHGGWSLLFDDVAGADVHVDDDLEALARTIIEANLDLVVVSPGAPAYHPVFSAYGAAGIEVWSEVELVWRLQEKDPHAGHPWLIVTGANGRATTAGVLGKILRCAGVRAEEISNIGTPITWTIDPDAEVFAMELSSFRLHTVRTVLPLASTYLNMDVDHLGWHGNVKAHAVDKARVCENTIRVCVCPASDRWVEWMMENAGIAEGAYAARLIPDSPSVSRFGVIEGLLVNCVFVEDRVHHTAALAHISDLAGARGPHPPAVVVSDALAAAVLAHAYSVGPEAIEASLRVFQSAGHRHAITVHTADLAWVDDLKATNAHAACVFLAGLPSRSAIWVVDSDAKGQDFTELIRQVEPTLRGVVAIGEGRVPLMEALQAGASDVPHVEVGGHEGWMFSVVNKAVALPMPGDTVVLAPACASWDQFDSYDQCGDVFADVVSHLATQWGSAGGDEQVRLVHSDDHATSHPVRVGAGM